MRRARVAFQDTLLQPFRRQTCRRIDRHDLIVAVNHQRRNVDLSQLVGAVSCCTVSASNRPCAVAAVASRRLARPGAVRERIPRSRAADGRRVRAGRLCADDRAGRRRSGGHAVLGKTPELQASPRRPAHTRCDIPGTSAGCRHTLDPATLRYGFDGPSGLPTRSARANSPGERPTSWRKSRLKWAWS